MPGRRRERASVPAAGPSPLLRDKWTSISFRPPPGPPLLELRTRPTPLPSTPAHRPAGLGVQAHWGACPKCRPAVSQFSSCKDRRRSRQNWGAADA